MKKGQDNRLCSLNASHFWDEKWPELFLGSDLMSLQLVVLEIVPNLFVWIEIWRIRGEVVKGKSSLILFRKLFHFPCSMNRWSVFHHDNLSVWVLPQNLFEKLQMDSCIHLLFFYAKHHAACRTDCWRKQPKQGWPLTDCRRMFSLCCHPSTAHCTPYAFYPSMIQPTIHACKQIVDGVLWPPSLREATMPWSLSDGFSLSQKSSLGESPLMSLDTTRKSWLER